MLTKLLAAFLPLATLLPVQAATPMVIPVATPVSAPLAKSALPGVPVAFNREAMFALSPGDEVELRLPDGRRQAYAFDETIDYGGGIRSWVGKSTQPGRGERAVVTVGPDAVWGFLNTAWGEYRLFPGKGGEWLSEVLPVAVMPSIGGGDTLPARDDPPQLAPLKGIPTRAAPLMGQKGAPLPKATPSPAFTLDLMILYTTDLADKMGPALMPMLYNFVTNANKVFADSEVALNVRLIYTAPVALPNSVGSGFALEGMAGNLSEATTFQSLTWGAGSLRNQVGADVVVLARDNPAEASIVAGIAKILRNTSLYPTVAVAQSDAYQVLTSCARGCEGVFAHELGHNLGLMHDRASIARDFGGTVPTDIGVFPYAFGHYQCANGLTCNPFVAGGCTNQFPTCVNPGPDDFGTVMSLIGNRAFRYSNPLIACPMPRGTAPGGPCGIASQNDNARAMNETRQNASAYRSAIPALASLPGSMQFTKAAYAGAETGGTLVFTVSRIGGSAGAVSANYTVTGNSAAVGADFTGLSGTLNWAAGDAADKTFTVVLANDGLAEGIESVTATLSNPAGAFGVHLGHPSTAVGLLLEPWPPGGFTPLGFASSTAPPTEWDVAFDSFDPAGGDSVSFKSSVLDPGTTGMSNTRFTGTFVNGPVAFAYRVSGYLAGGLEFYVDGVLRFSAAGVDVAWKLASIPITAGTHALEWRFSKTLDFPCRFALGPNGESYPDCQDRAWIDSVSLPLAPVAPLSLAVAKAGSGAGTVTSSPSGIACGAACAGSFRPGTVVKLTPAPSAGSVFTGWTGGGCAGTGPCFVLLSQATTVSAAFDISSTAAPRLANISTRMQVFTGADVLIGGFIIQGAASKTVVVRARGPSLTAAGVPGSLQNPVLQLFSDQTVIASNDDWGAAPNAATIQSSGFAPADARESAIHMTLAPGAYTAIVTGAGGTTGVGIIEVFEVDLPGVPLANISTRGRVLTGADVMIGGFIIQGNSPQTVVVRARGPSLTAAGVPGALANPMLQLFSGPTQIAVNDNWQAAANAASIQASGFAPSDANESAILVTLAPGAYTAIVTGAGGTTGVGIIEVFAQ